jgi:hypothetical protein
MPWRKLYLKADPAHLNYARINANDGDGAPESRYHSPNLIPAWPL